MAKKQKTTDRHTTCTVERTMRIEEGTLNLASGAMRTTGHRVEVRACGTPLWGDEERARGVCRGCASGWEVPGNMPTDAGRARIAGGAS